MDFGASGAAYKQGPEALPASAYLQERLQERRSRNSRQTRSRQSDFGPRTAAGLDDDIFLAEAEDSRNASAHLYDNSPLAPFAKYGSDARGSTGSVNGNTLSGGGRRRRNPGAKEQDEQMDRLTKQNFDLKLELDHRREQQAKMHAQIERMRDIAERAETLHEEHAELLRINTLLVEELEKRDRAMQEAVDIICDLEEKVDVMEQRRMVETRPSTAQADSGYAGTETQEQMLGSSPPGLARPAQAMARPPVPVLAASSNLNGMLQAQTSAKPKREPSFLSQKKPSTKALRSVFLEAGKAIHPVQSFNSILSKRTSRMNDEAPQDEVLNSPRLSALSESSFPSMYSPKKAMSPERHAWEPEDDLSQSEPNLLGSSHLRQDSISRVSRWIEERQSNDSTPSMPNRISSPLSLPMAALPPQLPRPSDHEHFQSLNDALSPVAGHPDTNAFDAAPATKPSMLRAQKGRRIPKGPANLSGPIFGDAFLPPTPDSVSTRMLRASRSSIVDTRSMLDTAPARIRSFEPLDPASRATPRQMQFSSSLGSAHRNNSPCKGKEHDVLQSALSEDATGDYSSESENEELGAFRKGPRDHSFDPHDYPDGASIVKGTPSRFLKHTAAPVAISSMFFNSTDVLTAHRPEPSLSLLHRRKSSSEVNASQRKPSLSRADTSPMYVGSRSRMAGATEPKNPAFQEALASPDSYRSGASSVRTAFAEPLQPSAHSSRSPETTHFQPAASINSLSSPGSSPSKIAKPTSASIASSQKPTLTQKTQQLLRRISNSHADRDRDRETHRSARWEREVSPLPTLTSTPSSAYANDRPSQVRRPSTSGIARSPSSPPFLPLSMRPGTAPRRASRDSSTARPNLHGRTMTEPAQSHTRAASAEAASAVAENGPEKKRNLFRRGGSIRRVEEKEGEGSVIVVGRKGSTKEAGSGGKRPWR